MSRPVGRDFSVAVDALPVTFKLQAPSVAAVTVSISLVPSNIETLLFASAVPLSVVDFLAATTSNITGEAQLQRWPGSRVGHCAGIQTVGNQKKNPATLHYARRGSGPFF